MEKELEYELTTIKDIFDKVPSDRIRVCLHELGIAMEQTKAMAELLGATAEVVTGVSDGLSAVDRSVGRLTQSVWWADYACGCVGRGVRRKTDMPGKCLEHGGEMLSYHHGLPPNE